MCVCVAVKEAAVQRRHNLYRDSIVLSNSDPSLHLLGDNPSIDWAGEYGGGQEKTDGPQEEEEGGEGQKKRRMKQVVSMIQVEGSDLPSPEYGAQVPSIRDVSEEDGQEQVEQEQEQVEEEEQEAHSDAANPPDLSRASVSEMYQIQPEEQCKNPEPLGGETAAGVMEDKATPSDLEGGERLPPSPPTGAAEGSWAHPPEVTSQPPPPPHDGGGCEAGEEEPPSSSAAPQPVEDQTAEAQ